MHEMRTGGNAMSSDPARREEIRLAITGWANKYTARLDQIITNAWPDLANRLEACMASLFWSELAFGPGKDFQQRCLDPAVERWQERLIQPLIQVALDDLTDIFEDKQSGLAPDAVAPAFAAEGQLEKLDVLKLLSLPGGVLIAGSAVFAAIVTTTKLLIFTTVIVYWPLLIGGAFHDSLPMSPL
jgi:hypothetical protein